jgi:hypothetical protein
MAACGPSVPTSHSRDSVRKRNAAEMHGHTTAIAFDAHLTTASFLGVRSDELLLAACRGDFRKLALCDLPGCPRYVGYQGPNRTRFARSELSRC